MLLWGWTPETRPVMWGWGVLHVEQEVLFDVALYFSFIHGEVIDCVHEHYAGRASVVGSPAYSVHQHVAAWAFAESESGHFGVADLLFSEGAHVSGKPVDCVHMHFASPQGQRFDIALRPQVLFDVSIPGLLIPGSVYLDLLGGSIGADIQGSGVGLTTEAWALAVDPVEAGVYCEVRKHRLEEPE